MLWIFMWIFRLDEKSKFVDFVNWLGDFLMPILGYLGFIPFISICLNIFVCDKPIGNSFADSFYHMTAVIFTE
ncbi:unnamed protein product [Blepharisma stoltei]|uniref:Uncharacterized protein n=1 Tax=Blepharisma stoltei TaxID=1481888 RepID=A0AAU9J497_9CILI|nr:unnamed protein product [Blepharisma stoltei]